MSISSRRYKNIIRALLLSASACSAAWGLDLGEMEVISRPGEPFSATIRIIDISPSSSRISIGFATKKEFSASMIERSPTLNKIRFVGIEKRNGKDVIIVRSNDPLQEESMHFLLAAQEPNSRVLREYVIINEDNMYLVHAQPSLIELTRQQTPRPLKAQELELPLPYVAIASSAKSSETLPTLAAATPKAVKKTASRQSTQVYSQDQYRVNSGDSLWYIAKEVQQNNPDASFHQVLAALYEANPNAFIDGDINRLKSGTTLAIPSATVLSSVPQSAVRQVTAQMNGTVQPIQSVAEISITETKDKIAVEVSEKTNAANLKIIAAETSKETVSQMGAADEETLSENMALVNEKLLQAQRENDDLMTRVQALQAQINTLNEMMNVRKQEENTSIGDVLGSFSDEGVKTTPAVNSAEKAAASTSTVTSGSGEETPGLAVKPSEDSELWKNTSISEWFNYLALGLGVLLLLIVAMAVGTRKRKKSSKGVMPSPSARVAALFGDDDKPAKKDSHHHGHKSHDGHKSHSHHGKAAPESMAAVSISIAKADIKPQEKLKPVAEVKTAEVKNIATANTVAAEKPAVHKAQERKPKSTHGLALEEDKVATKLELARAYHDLGDDDNAVTLLQEVLWEGDGKQRKAAQEWLSIIDEERKM